jgi:hypothetical protein
VEKAKKYCVLYRRMHKKCIFANETRLFDVFMSNVIKNIRIGGITNIVEIETTPGQVAG